MERDGVQGSGGVVLLSASAPEHTTVRSARPGWYESGPVFGSEGRME